MGANNRFLYKIANELFSKHGNDLSNILVVFPSRRAHIFFTDELSNLIDQPIWLPKFYSIEDFFFKVINYDKAHKLDLFFTFYKLYTKHVQNPQTIDQCYKWVPILLEDFDEIDKSIISKTYFESAELNSLRRIVISAGLISYKELNMNFSSFNLIAS